MCVKFGVKIPRDCWKNGKQL